MILTGQQKAKIKAAILKAYREEELGVLLTEEMDLSYEEIARGGDYTTRVSNLIQNLESEGRLEKFIAAIKKKKPDSPYLKDFKVVPSGTPSNLPSSGTPYFVGREDTLEQVHRKLQENNQLAICAVSGMGGVGKTELAVQYAIRYKEDYSGGLCWLQGRVGDIGSQIVSFALSRLGLAIPEGLEPPDQVGYCWQHWKEGQVLLVYDDVTDFQAIAPFLPPRDMARFKILMTSRQQAGANYNSLNLNVLDEGSALELLRSLVGQERIDAELDGAKALCTWLGYLPLGLELVGRSLKNNSSLTLVRLQERLNRTKLQAQAFVPPEQGDMTAKLGVAAAFELSWQDEKLTEEAKELGCRLSLFAPAPINWSLLEACYLGTQVWLVEQVENLEGEDYQSFLEWVKEENESLEEAGDKVQEWLSGA
jgi:hypothetical protein